jgi:hypothetical protein
MALILKADDLAGLGELSGLRSLLLSALGRPGLDTVDVCGRLCSRVRVGEGEKSNLRLSVSGSTGRLFRSSAFACGVVDLTPTVLTRFEPENSDEVASVVVDEMSDSADDDDELEPALRRFTLNESSDFVGVLRLLSFFFSLKIQQFKN